MVIDNIYVFCVTCAKGYLYRWSLTKISFYPRIAPNLTYSSELKFSYNIWKGIDQVCPIHVGFMAGTCLVFRKSAFNFLLLVNRLEKKYKKCPLSCPVSYYFVCLVSGHDLACQQEVSLALTKTPPIHYYNVVDSAFSNYVG